MDDRRAGAWGSTMRERGPSHNSDEPPVLLGRHTELAVLADRLDSNAPIAVVGEPGIGKTALLQAGAALTARTVYQASGFTTLNWLSYAPFARILGWPVPEGDGARLAAEIEMIVGDGVLILDDLQWCDRATRSLVPLLTGRIALLLAVRHGDPVAPTLMAELRDADVGLLDLAPLAPQAALALALQVRPNLPPTKVAQLLRRAGGNPLLIRELAATNAPSPSLRRALDEQLRVLPADVRDSFGLLSILGRAMPLDRLGSRVDKLISTGLVQVEAGMITVRHALLGEMAVEGLARERRRRLHEDAAEIVDSPGEAARHMRAAGHRRVAFELASQAAAAAILPGERASHLALAAECVPDTAAADQLRLDAAAALVEAGEDAAAKTALEHVRGKDARAQARLLLLRTQIDWSTGDGAGARAALDEALTITSGMGAEVDVEVEVRLAQARVAAFVDGAYGRSVESASAALELARRHELPTSRAHYLIGTALALNGSSGWSAHLDSAIAGARDDCDHDVELRAANNLIGAHEMTGDPNAAAALATLMIARARDLGLVAWQRQFTAMRANLDMLAGRYDDAVEQADDLLAQALEPRTRDQVEVTRTHALIDLGRFEEARDQITRSLRSAAPDAMGRAQFTYLAAEIDFWSGRHRQAIKALDDLLATVEPGFEIAVFAALGRARAHAEMGIDPGDLQLPHHIAFFEALPTEVAALHALVTGDNRVAAGLFEESACGWEPYHLRNSLYCLWHAGEALRLAGDLADAADRLAQVEAAVECRGMAPLLGRVRRSIRLAGRRRVTPRPSSTGGLTSGERQVVRLVHEGLTNAEIATRLGLSRRTVETQLSTATAKLGVRSRLQAAALYDEQ